MNKQTNKQTAAATTTSELRIFAYFVFAVFVFSYFVLLCCTLRSQQRRLQRCQQQQQQESTIMSVALLHAHAHARSLTSPSLSLPLSSSLSVLLSLSLTLCLLRFVVVSSSCKRSLNNFVWCQKLFIFKSSATLKVPARPLEPPCDPAAASTGPINVAFLAKSIKCIL